MRDLFERKIRPSKELSDDIAHYDRSPEGHDDHTYKFLLESVSRAIARQKMHRNRADRDEIVNRSGVDPNAFPGEGDKTPKPKVKAKTRPRRRRRLRPRATPEASAVVVARAASGTTEALAARGFVFSSTNPMVVRRATIVALNINLFTVRRKRILGSLTDPSPQAEGPAVAVPPLPKVAARKVPANLATKALDVALARALLLHRRASGAPSS